MAPAPSPTTKRPAATWAIVVANEVASSPTENTDSAITSGRRVPKRSARRPPNGAANTLATSGAAIAAPKSPTPPTSSSTAGIAVAAPTISKALHPSSTTVPTVSTAYRRLNSSENRALSSSWARSSGTVISIGRQLSAGRSRTRVARVARP